MDGKNRLNNNSVSKTATASTPFFGMGFGEYLAILARGKWRVMAVCVIVVALVTALTMFMKPTYESTVSLLVDTRQSPSALFQDARTLGMTVDIIQNEMAILSSRLLADAVAEELVKIKYLDSAKKVMLPIVLPVQGDTLNREIASIPTVVTRLSKTVTFASERESYILTITATSTNPNEAAIVANAYAKAYFDRNVHASRAKSRSFREFLGRQLTEKREQLKGKEDSLQLYMQRRGVVSLDEETRSLMGQMASLEASRDENDIEIRSLLSTLSSYKAQIDEQEKSIAKTIGEANDPYIKSMQEQLARIEVQRDITFAQNRSAAARDLNNELIKEYDRQIADLRAKLQARTQEYLQNLQPAPEQQAAAGDPTGYLKEIKQKFIQTQVAIQTLQAKRDAMNEALEQYSRQFGHLPAKSIEYARLVREKSSMEQLYALLETKYNEANVTEESEFGYVEIVDPAFVPLEPSSPNMMLNVILGVVLGLGFGVAYVFVREFIGERIYSPEDLARNGFVPLSVVAVFSQKKRKKSKGKDVSAAREGAYRTAMESPFSPFTEAFRHLRTNLLASNNGVAPKTIMITSPDPSEGKTTIATNLAIVLAQGGKKVLLVDADLREPAVHLIFGFDSKVGLAQMLSGNSGNNSLIKETRIATLHVLCSGQSSTIAAELLESADMRFFVSQVAERYDVVVLDSPPVLAVSDPLILSTMVDAVIMVVAAGVTTFSALGRAGEMLSHVKAKILGVVLNKFDARKAYGYSSGVSGYGYYGYADRYGKNGDEKRRESPKTTVA